MKVYEYRIVKIEKGLFLIEYKTAPFGVWHEVDKNSRLSQRQKLGLERTLFNEVKRMDKLEYIPGDLAFHYIPKTIIKKYVKVYVCSTQNALSLEDMDGKLYDYIGELYPIPLTPEILEKNGWKKEVMSRGVKNSHWVYTKPDIEEYGYFPIYIEKGIGDEFDVYPFTGNHVCTQIAYIKYVHQLQNLLFGLGINHEMEL